MKMHKTTLSPNSRSPKTFFFGGGGGMGEPIETENAFQTSGVYLENLQQCIS